MYISSALGIAARRFVSEQFSPQIEKVKRVANSTLGKTVIGVVGNSVGSMIGAAAPVLTTSYAVGASVAGSYGKYAGIGAGLAVGALSTGLSYMTTGDDSLAEACSFVITSVGTIAGGLMGTNAAGGEAKMPGELLAERQKQARDEGKDAASVSVLDAYLDSYPMRTGQYLVAAGVAAAFPSVATVAQVAVGAAVGAATAVVKEGDVLAGVGAGVLGAAAAGPVAPVVAGMAGYYAKDLVDVGVKVYNRKPPPDNNNPFDPGEAVKVGIEGTYGSTGQFKAEIAGNVHAVPILGWLAGSVQKLVGSAVDDKRATTSLVRSLDEYMKLMQGAEMQKISGEFAQKLETLTGKDLDGARNDFRWKIYETVRSILGWTEYALAALGRRQTKEALRAMADDYADQLMDVVEKKEIELVGVQLGDSQKTRAFLKAHVYNFLTLAAIRLEQNLLSKGETKHLADEEINQFYQNMTTLAFSPYSGSTVGKTVERGVKAVLPALLKHAQFAPRQVYEKLRADRAEESTLQSLPDKLAPTALAAPKTFLSQVRDFFSTLFSRVITIFRKEAEETKPATLEEILQASKQVRAETKHVLGRSKQEIADA